MFETDIPVYLITGFLESGKTTFLKFTLEQEYFQIDGKTLLILTEEGEEEYDAEKLKREFNTVIEVVEEPDEFTPGYLKLLQKQHRPERVIIEYNPLWSVAGFVDMDKPRGWDLAQHIVTVDASCFEIYMKNLKSLFVEMVRGADMVVFNRSSRDYPLASFRRSVKVVNQSAEILFEDEDGELQNIFEEELPFDLNAKVVEILPEDYGIWYVDMMDHPGKYEGKTVRYVGMVLKSRNKDADYFLPGRKAVTCCEDDMSFIGYVCRTPQVKELTTGTWVEVTGVVKLEENPVYHEESPVIYAVSIEEAEKPEEPLVYFN